MTTTTNSADVPWKRALAETNKLQRELDITNADHIALWIEHNTITDEPMNQCASWLACRIVEAHEAALNRRTESADDALLRRLRPYVANVVEAEGALINKRDLEAIDAHLSRPRPARDEADRLAHLEAEARRFAGFYPAGSDGRNTFVIFADKIACEARALKGQKP